MNALSTPVSTPESAAELYAAVRAGSILPLSISLGVEALRAANPDNTLSNRQLADLLATAAVRRGISVYFDQNRIKDGFFSVQLDPRSWG